MAKTPEEWAKEIKAQACAPIESSKDFEDILIDIIRQAQQEAREECAAICEQTERTYLRAGMKGNEQTAFEIKNTIRNLNKEKENANT